MKPISDSVLYVLLIFILGCAVVFGQTQGTAQINGVVKDPTGAGDSFAGGFMGYIASQGELNREVLKRALFYGGVMGSFTVERFGTERLQSLTKDDIEARFQIFRELTHLE